MSQKPKKDFYRTYQTSDSLSFLDASLVKRLEPLLAQRDRPGCVDLPSFVSMIYDLASRNSDLRKGEELSYVECLCVLFQAVADSQVLLPGIDAPEALSFNELDWSWVTDFFIREKISSVKIKDPNEEEEAGAAGAQGGSGGEGQRDAPRFTVSKIADYSTHPGDVCALMAWHRWGLILSADREYPAVKVYDPYQQPHGPPIYCGDLPFFPYNMSGGSLIRRSDVTLHDFIQNMCTPPTAMDVKKGSKLKEERIMVPPRQVVYPPKGAFPIMVAVDEKNDTLGVIFSSRHLCFWQCGDGGLRLTAIYPVHTAFTGLWYVEKSLGEWIGAFADFNLGVYNREQLRLKYGSPMSFSLVPQRSNADVKLVAPLAILRGHMDQVVMIIPIQEDYMASASYDCNVLIWERKTGAQMKRISSGVGLRGIAYNWTMDLLMTVGFAPEASLYQLGKIDDGSATSSIKRAGVLRGHISGLTCCAFMGPHMAITCDDVGYIRLWDLKNGQNSCFQMIQSDTVAQSIALVHRLEEGYVKMGHFSRQARERAEFTLQELLTQQEDSDFVIGGERLLKIRKMGQHPQAGNIPQIIFADICYLNHSLVVVTEQYVYAFHAESGVQLRAVSAQQIFADAEDKVAEKERDNYEIAREHAEESAARGSRFAFPGSVPGSPTTSGGGSPGGGASVVGSNPGGRSTTSPNAGGSKSGGKGGLLGEEEEGASQKTVSREADSRLQTSVERAFTTEIMGKRVYRKQELKKLALERKYGVGFDKKNKFSKTSSAGFFGGLFAPEVSSPSPRRRRRSGSHMNSDDSDTQGGGRGGKKGGRGERGAGGLGGNTMNSTSTMSDQKSQMSKTHSGSFFRGRAGKKSPHSYSSESEADDLDLDEINEHLLEDNHQIRKDNRGMETISSACFDATQARLILGSDRGKIIIVDNKRFQPVCPRLRNTHMAGKSVTHLVYIPQTATNIGHYRYYNYGLQKGAHIAEIQHMMQEPKNQQFLPSVEHFLRPPLNLPEGLIASGGSDGTILLVSDNPARGYPLQFRLTYSQDACRLKNLFFDFDSGYLVSVTDSYIKWWEPHLDNGEPARTIPLTQKNLHALGVAKGEPNAADPAGSVSFATTGGIASSSALGGDGPGGVVVGTGGAASSTGSMVLGGPSGGGGLLGAQPGGGGLVGVQNGALLASSLVASSSSAPGGGTPQQALPRYLPLRSDQLIGSAALRWRRYNNNLAFSVDATTGEIFCINMERGEVETRFHHRKTIIHKDEIHDVQFKTTAMCLVEWDVNKLEWADPAKKSGPVAFSQRPPTQTPPSTAERDATRGKRPSLAELESFPNPSRASSGTPKSDPGSLGQFPYFKDFQRVLEQAWGRDVMCDLPDGLDERRIELEQQKVWFPQVTHLRQRNLYAEADKLKQEFEKMGNMTGGEQGGSAADKAKSIEASSKLFEKQTFFITQDPTHETQIFNAMGCDADKQEPVVRFLSVLNDLGNRSEIEIQAASELAADLSYLQDLEMEQLRKYLSDPTVFEVYSNILGHLDNSFWGPDGNPIDDSSDRIVSVRTGKLKKSLMGKSRLPADLDEIEGPQKAEKPPSDPEITASGAPESTAAAPGAVPEGAGTTTQGGSSSSSSSKKKKRVKDPVDLFERRQKYKERAKDLFRTPVTPYESRDQSCILALGSEKGEISLVRVTPERVAPRAKTTTTNGASAADSENNSLSAATAGMSNDDAFAYVFGGKSLKLHRETICTWQAHEPGQKITSLKLLPGVQALISCGDSCSVKIWPLDTYFGSDGRDPEDELNGVDHCWVQDQSVLDSVESYRHDTKKLILSDTVFYKKPWVNVVLGPDVTSKTLAWYMPRCLRKSLLFKYQAYRVLEKLRTQDLLGEEEGSLHVQTSIKLYDRYYGKLKAEQDLKNEYARREAEKLKEKSKGISLVEVKSYTVSSVKPLPEPDSLRPLTIFKEMTQTHEKPWVSNWQPMKHVLREQEQRKAQAAAAKDEKKGRRASVTNLQLGKKKKAKGKDPDADMFFPDRLNKASHEWNFERLYGKGGAGHPAGEKVLRRTYSDIKSGLSWRPEYDQFNTDRKRRVEEDNTQRRRRKPGQPDITSNHLPAEERMKILMETIAEPLVHEHRDPTSERMATRKWQSFVDKEKASLPQSSNIDWLRTTMPARFRTDKTQGAASPERHISSPEKTRFLTTLSDFSAVRRRVEGTKPSKDTRDKFKPEVNVGRDFAVSGGDVMLKGGEAARRRVSDMQQMLLRQYPRRPPEEEQMLMDLASKPGAILM